MVDSVGSSLADARLLGSHVFSRIDEVIVSFADPATEALYHGAPDGRSRRFPADILRTSLRKLDMLASAHQRTDLRAPPGNRLEALRGNFSGLHFIRVNDQWRIVFRWTPSGAADVRLIDYH